MNYKQFEMSFLTDSGQHKTDIKERIKAFESAHYKLERLLDNGFLKVYDPVTSDQVEHGFHSGACDDSVKEILDSDNSLVIQLSNLNVPDIDDYLLEHDLSICEDLVNTPLEVKYEYVLWMACSDCQDNPEEYLNN